MSTFSLLATVNVDHILLKVLFSVIYSVYDILNVGWNTSLLCLWRKCSSFKTKQLGWTVDILAYFEIPHWYQREALFSFNEYVGHIVRYLAILVSLKRHAKYEIIQFFKWLAACTLQKSKRILILRRSNEVKSENNAHEQTHAHTETHTQTYTHVYSQLYTHKIRMYTNKDTHTCTQNVDTYMHTNTDKYKFTLIGG